MTRIYLTLLALSIFACGQPGNELTEGEKQNIINEVRPLIIEFTEGSEKGDLKTAFKYYRRSDDFKAILNGQVLDFDTFKKAAELQFQSLKSQDYTITSEGFNVLSSTAVMYTLTGSDIDQLKDGSRVFVNPLVASFLFQKVKNEWGIVYFNESATVKIDSSSYK